jgi:hypothetical protein
MKKYIIGLALLSSVTPAFADGFVPYPPLRPYQINPHREQGIISGQRTFRIVMPNGRVRQCVVTNGFQQGRGMVHTRACWRIR